MNICVKCKYRWVGLVNNPKQCPRCKRYDWKEKTGKTTNGFPLLILDDNPINTKLKGGKRKNGNKK